MTENSKRLFLQILDRHPKDRNLVIGEASRVRKSDGTYTLIMACPRCGQELILSQHNIVWHDQKTVTVEPSLVHKESRTYSEQILHKVQDCMAHFFIKNGDIIDLA